jgi:hypothetical protein
MSSLGVAEGEAMEESETNELILRLVRIGVDSGLLGPSAWTWFCLLWGKCVLKEGCGLKEW